MKIIENLIQEDKYKEAINQLHLFIQKNITGSDLNSLKIRSDFRMLQSEFITQSIQNQVKFDAISYSSKKEDLRESILALLKKLNKSS